MFLILGLGGSRFEDRWTGRRDLRRGITVARATPEEIQLGFSAASSFSFSTQTFRCIRFFFLRVHGVALLARVLLARAPSVRKLCLLLALPNPDYTKVQHFFLERLPHSPKGSLARSLLLYRAYVWRRGYVKSERSYICCDQRACVCAEESHALNLCGALSRTHTA